MDNNSNRKQRRSIRLPEYDYSQNGYYFVTICCREKKCLFGRIRGGEMMLNTLGEKAEEEWKKTEEMRKDISLGEFIIMPNHMHGIIIIGNKSTENRRGTMPRAQQTEEFGRPTKNTIPTIIRGFKSAVTKYAKQNRYNESPWQRNYHEHVIRSDDALEKISDYIKYNPILWEKDKYFQE